MRTLDLHGAHHASVQSKVENFVLSYSVPLRIITGNSTRMQALVRQILERYDFGFYYESDYNLGSLIITDNTKYWSN